MRVAVGGIEHETCGFAASDPDAGTATLLTVARTLLRGEELRQLGEANTVVDGLIRSVRESGLELVPLLWIDANTSSPVTRESLETATEELLDRLRLALPVDGVLLSLRAFTPSHLAFKESQHAHVAETDCHSLGIVLGGPLRRRRADQHWVAARTVRGPRSD